MRIGIDITLLGAIYTGQHFYIISLLKELFKIGKGDQFFLFSYSNNGINEFSHFNNVEIIPIIKGKYKNYKRILYEYFKLPKIVKKYNLDVFFSPAFIMNIRNKRIKKIVTIHDLIYKQFPKTFSFAKNKYLEFILSKSLKNADKIIAISQNTKNDIIKYFKVKPSKIIVNYYGVDFIFEHSIDEKILKAKRKELNLPEKYFVYVGTLEPRKNIPYALKNFDRFVEEYRDYKFILYGWKGEMPEDVFNTIEKLKNKDKVEFRDYISHDLLPYVYKLSKGLIFVSLYEGFGLPPVEAMLSRCPVFVSRESSIPEVVKEAGIYVDIEKKWDLYEQFIWAEKNQDKVNEKIKIGKDIAKNYTWEKAAQNTYKLLKDG